MTKTKFDHSQLRGAFAAGFSAAHGVEYPKGDTPRRKALIRLKTDPIVQECVTIEPRLIPILESAKHQENHDGYHRIRRYIELRNQITPLVGWKARDPRIKTTQHYDAIIKTIDGLLPQDEVDLYPDGRPE